MRRRSAHRLAKLQARDHVVQGLLSALKRVDAIIHVMKTSKDAVQAREALVSPAFGFSTDQVHLSSRHSDCRGFLFAVDAELLGGRLSRHMSWNL